MALESRRVWRALKALVCHLEHLEHFPRPNGSFADTAQEEIGHTTLVLLVRFPPLTSVSPAGSAQ